MTVRSPGVITPDALGLLMVGSLSFVATTHLLQQPPSAPPLDLRMWVEVAFYVLSTAGCGAFFTWIVKRLDRLRAHEHRQNNHMARLVLESEQHADDLAAIRKALRIPR